MEEREDLKSMIPFLPLILRSNSLFWPPKTLASLKTLASGPDLSTVDSGEILFDAILELRDSVGLSNDSLAWKAADGYVLFFEELISRMDSRMWFREVVPALANLLLRLPFLLETHYRDSDEKFVEGKAGLRIMCQEEPGIVFLSQELIASLLACAFFCLFPTSTRGESHLPSINFDYLFASLHQYSKPSQEQKLKCLIHYFERISLCMPTGFVSFERKVLTFEQSSSQISYPEAIFWRTSTIPLCPFEVFSEGLIEDQKHDALEVDFANEYLGGGALHRGCVQEEIRFMINPELIVGMLFMASMKKNEAIEIVGVERFSRYMGYGSSFRFVGDYLDQKPHDSIGRRKTKVIAIDALSNPGIRQFEVEYLVRYGSSFRFVGDYLDQKPHDSIGRRKTKVIAIDALSNPGIRQFEVEYLVRDTNKAYCGFFYHSKHKCYLKNFPDVAFSSSHFHGHDSKAIGMACNHPSINDNTSSQSASPAISATSMDRRHPTDETCQDNTSIATGNWGCGAFGGDPEIKSIIQWLAASQALRPSIHYYTFGEPSLKRLEQVSQWILSHGWTVGDLWSMLVEYSSKKLKGETHVGFFSWLLPVQAASSGYMSE